jgi:hypothetical protein
MWSAASVFCPRRRDDRQRDIDARPAAAICEVLGFVRRRLPEKAKTEARQKGSDYHP